MISVAASLVKVNDVTIAYNIQGAGPPLVLVMGYRLSSVAWPVAFVEALARKFTVITLDNRGTGLSDKPVHGYAIANMARDLHGLLNELKIPRVHLLGYSMGGAIAQEFIRQFPDRVQSLMLCATMCGGARATYAKASVTRVMREIDGLLPAQVARRIWRVTYAPAYLERYQALAEEQSQREIAVPTPLHAADLQFQAFAEFDGSAALAEIACPALVLTGDLDELIPPQNSAMMANLIPDAKLVIVPGGGHRVLWEAPDECVDLISEFLSEPRRSISIRRAEAGQQRPVGGAMSASAVELFARTPISMTRAAFDVLAAFPKSIMTNGSSGFGDGKPIVLVLNHLASDVALLPFSMWLKALGYRPVTATPSDQPLALAIRDITQKVGRKAVLIAHASTATQVLDTSHTNKELVSDVIVFDARGQPAPDGLRVHYLDSGWPLLQGLLGLPMLLHSIEIELVELDAKAHSDDPRTLEGNAQ